MILYIIYSRSDLISYFYERYIVQTLEDPTASGRTTQIKNVINYFARGNFIEKIKVLMLGGNWIDTAFSEGIFNIISYYGIIVAIVFCLLLLYPIMKLYKNNKVEVLGLLAVFIAFMVDSSFNYPPGLMNYFLIAGILLQRQKMKQLENKELKI